MGRWTVGFWSGTALILSVGILLSWAWGTRAEEPAAPAQERNEESARLREEVRAILRELQLTAVEETPEEKRLRTIYDDGFYLVGPDDTLKIGGWAQSDTRWLEDNHPAASEFFTRRARLDVRGTLEKDFAYRFYTAFEGASARLQEGWIEYRRAPLARVRIGQFKEPFSLEAAGSSRWTAAVERALGPTNLSPQEDLGAQVHGALGDRRAEYAVGFFNGRGKNVSDTNDEKDAAARLTLLPFRNGPSWLAGLQVGASATEGRADDSLAGTEYRTAPRTAFVTFASGVTQAGSTSRRGVEAEWLAGPFGLAVEHLSVQREGVERAPYEEDVRSDAWYVTGTWLLTGESQPRNKTVRPARPLGEDGGWGAWGVHARIEEFDTQDRLFERGMATGTPHVSSWTAGVSWWPNRHIRVLGDLFHDNFDGLVTVSGRSIGDETGVLLRFQFDF
ncbi:MAG: hypothetical protein HY608_09070 [Planctomycetes bacterium]|nr:hypothetical protein [Planctomycetota bacterium]